MYQSKQYATIHTLPAILKHKKKKKKTTTYHNILHNNCHSTWYGGNNLHVWILSFVKQNREHIALSEDLYLIVTVTPKTANHALGTDCVLVIDKESQFGCKLFISSEDISVQKIHRRYSFNSLNQQP